MVFSHPSPIASCLSPWRSRLRESFYRAVSGGTRCERRTTSGPERASLHPPMVTQSAGRPANPAIARDFHGVTRFPADITSDIYGASVEVRSATVDWSYALTLRERVVQGRKKDRRTNGRIDGQRERKRGPEAGGSPELPSVAEISRRVIHVRASELLASSYRRCNKLTGSNWLSYNVASRNSRNSPVGGGEPPGRTSNSNVRRIISIADRLADKRAHYGIYRVA